VGEDFRSVLEELHSVGLAGSPSYGWQGSLKFGNYRKVALFHMKEPLVGPAWPRNALRIRELIDQIREDERTQIPRPTA